MAAIHKTGTALAPDVSDEQFAELWGFVAIADKAELGSSKLRELCFHEDGSIGFLEDPSPIV